jgi:hypothetical protein
MADIIKFHEFCKLNEGKLSAEPGEYFKQLGNALVDSEVTSPYGLWTCTSFESDIYSLTWYLNYPQHSFPFVNLKFKNNSISYFFYEPGRNKASSSGSFPFHYSLDIDKDAATIVEFFDAIVQWFENPEKYPCFVNLEKDENQKHKASPPKKVSPKDFTTSEKSKAFSGDKDVTGDKDVLEPGWDKDIPEVVDRLPKKTWRDTENENEIIKLFPYVPKTDEVLDLWKKAKQLRSNKLMNFVRQASTHVRDK